MTLALRDSYRVRQQERGVGIVHEEERILREK